MAVTDARSTSAAEFLDRHPSLPVLLLVLFPFALQLPFWLLGLSSDPLWFFSGVTRGAHFLPGYPVLDPNAGYTSEALGRLSAFDWVHGIVPWWNSYTGIGMPLAGELQPGSFFLPFNLLLLLPEGLLWQRLLMQVIAGVCTYALLRELRLSRSASLMGGALCAVNGVIAWTPGPAAVYCCLPFLPLLLWGIERARRPGQGAQSTLAVGAAIGWSILAGFPEPAYISGLLALAWGLFRLVHAPHRLQMVRRTLGGMTLGLMIASPLLVAFVDYLLQSDSLAKHAKPGAGSLPWAALSATVLPSIYGPPGGDSFSKLFGDIWGNIGGYTSILILLLAMAGLARRAPERGLRILLVCWVLVTGARSFGVPLITPIVNHLPLLKSAAFYRYAPSSWSFALIILASFGLDEFGADRLRTLVPDRKRAFAIAVVLALICIALAWPQRAAWGWTHQKMMVRFAKLGVSVVYTAAELLAFWLVWGAWKGEKRRSALAGLAVLDAAILFLIPQLSAVRHAKVDTGAIQFLESHQGLSRHYTLDPLEPNYGAYFQIAGIDHNVLPSPKLWDDYVDENLLPGLNRLSDGVIFWPDWNGYKPHAGEQLFNDRADRYMALGVRYLISDPGRDAVLPTRYHRVYNDELMDIWELPHPAPYFQVASGGPCTLNATERERVAVQCAAPAVLLRRELFMPGWEVSAGGRKPEAVRQSGIFQAAPVPAGASELRYRFTPPHVAVGWAACFAGLFGLLWQAARIVVARRRPKAVTAQAAGA